ncbi:MAG TPA: beta-L-arabinofuranosidase domain-containing protein [Chthonomonadaceae bacterium]|nr:beta-L-arabinofuranosidase domain-containing protein [Chthonomonadaceae bacterium]
MAFISFHLRTLRIAFSSSLPRGARLLAVLAASVILLIAGPAGRAHAQGATGGERVLLPFNYRGVTLDDGPLKRQFDETRDYYLRIPNDDLLKGFRQRAGLTAPGADLGGWYSGDIFHIFGQIVSGLARMYAATGDTACRDKADALVREWARCIEPDGFFFYSRRPNAPHYVYDKMVGGLVDDYVYCHNRGAITALDRITTWAEKHLDRRRPYGADANEWYTLSENLYRAHLVTGETRYREFARVWEYTEYWNRYALGQDVFGPGGNGQRIAAYHAYSHVNTLGGAGAAYVVTGERHYLDTLTHAYETLIADQCFATGGYGPDEQLLPRAALLDHLQQTHNSFETQCGSWAAFKMSKYLISFTGDAKYGDWVERLVLNGIGASIPMAANGRVFYYSDYNPSGAEKANCPDGWTCCAGTRPMAIADYHDQIYYHDPNNSLICVSLYTPSTVRWSRLGGAVTLRQSTRFPIEDRCEFSLELDRSASFAVSFRIPGWLRIPMSVWVNGAMVKPREDKGWATLSRTWRPGDKIQVELPMGLHASRLDPARPYPAAMMLGPVVLAARATPSQIAGKIDLDRLSDALTASKDEPLTWHVADAPGILVRPFYAFKEGEPYLLYLDPASANRIPYREVAFSGPWNPGGQFRYSNAAGASAEASFEGRGVRWLGYCFDDAGRAQVKIDGKIVATVDQYGPGRGLPFDWKTAGLAPGPHTIRITVLADKTPASKDRFINVAGFEVTP